MNKIPAIKSVMTAFPYWVDVDDTVAAARTMMSEHEISHLPVKEGGNLIGVVALHDIQKMGAATTIVKDVCVLEPYMVDLDAPLDNVLVHMANFHIGSALVLKNNRLAGVFTMHDACRCFADSLRYQFREETGNDIA
ncbi:MAG: CBS domain-containing protein [Gammaproteobacteria bacterium]|nr:CBS domain-containing protein [Gammaproteobacteria bacterium]